MTRQAQAVDQLTKQFNEATGVYNIHNETAVHTGQRPGPDARLPVPTALPVVPPRQTPVAQAWRDMEQLRAALERLSAGGDPLNDKQTAFVQEAVSLIEGHTIRVDKLREELVRIFTRQNGVNEAYDRLLQYLQSQQQNAGNRSMSQ